MDYKKRRNRTFSDMSIAESCIDTHEKQKRTLLQRQPCINILNKGEVTTLINFISQNYQIIDTTNILEITELLYYKIEKKHDSETLKTIIIEILSEVLDQTHSFDFDYVTVYRPILKDIIPSFIQFIQKKKKRKRFFFK